MSKKESVIIGAGLVGSLLSIYLSKRGYKVKIYERRADMRKQEMIAGRSINLALSDRGIRALEEVGLMDEIRKICIPMHGRFMHNADGTTAYQAYGNEGQFINSVSRGDLNCKLMDLAEENGVQIMFNEKCNNIDWKENKIEFEKTNSPQSEIVMANLIFGSDGAFSAARLTYQMQHDRFQYQQYYIDFGYKELTIPTGVNGIFLLEKNALHIWPRGNYMMIALPNIDGSFTCTLFFPFTGKVSFDKLKTVKEINDFFQKTFPDAVALMPELLSDFQKNPTSSLVTVKCFPWVRNRTLLIGDAAHAIVPFFGQGMNAGFEDCRILNQLLEKYNDNWDKVLPEFQQVRKPDADAIAQLALDNFIEMRDLVADADFLLRKKIEAKLHELFPDRWIPLYSMVTFYDHILYSDAYAVGQKQKGIMDEVMKIKEIESNWQILNFEKIVKKLSE